MNRPPEYPEQPAWLEDDDPHGLPDIDPRDHIYSLGVDFDIDAQLRAIRDILRRHREAGQALTDEIYKVEEHARRLSGIRNEQAVAEWIDRMHDSVYQDAAHSMAAAGMLAPLIETIFYQCFLGMGSRFFYATNPAICHVRWSMARAKQWDCHYEVKDGKYQKGLSRGIVQLADAVGLTSWLPANLEPTLSALFTYRNNMFHHGFEWPVDERERFEQRIVKESWPSDWFSMATSGGKPWIFYLSEVFIEHCLTTTDQVLDAFGSFVRDELLPKR